MPVRIQDSDLSNSDQVREELQNRQNSQKMYFDRRSKDLPPLISGQDVCIQNSQYGQWEKAKVLSKCEEPRSYLVSTPEGQTYRRNRVHLRESPQPSPKKNVRFTEPCTNISSPNHCHNEESNPNISQKSSYDQAEGDKAYTTRSGRLVKKPDKIDL